MLTLTKTYFLRTSDITTKYYVYKFIVSIQQKNNPLNHLLFCSTFDIKVKRLSS